MKPKDELRHLQFGALQDDTVEGVALLLFKVHCRGNASVVLQNCREILGIVLQQYETVWLSEDEWRKKLPDWFVKTCAPERTLEEEEEDLIRWHTLSHKQQQIQEEEEKWSVMDWISWFESSDDPFNQRTWFWWDAFVWEPDLLLVVIEVVDLPVPVGSMVWLLRASGALKVEEAELAEAFFSFPAR
ncbi:hypothetical protein [Scytonema sp. NUACC26]|uniref:hypothetical protein n=1 Tax=Scytonema sp. NUACC26 TaxID=3140176 RepID=UPI0034DC59BD